MQELARVRRVSRRPLRTLGICLLVVPLSLLAFGLSEAAAGGPAPQSDRAAAAQGVFAKSCAMSWCHAGSKPKGGMVLKPGQFVTSTVGVPSQEVPSMKRIEPGRPEASYLWWKITGAADIEGERMPFGVDPLPRESLNAIRAWIESLTEADIVTETPAATSTAGPTFYGWRIVNAPTAEVPEKGIVLFRIAHRWRGMVKQGYDDFFGLDGGASMYLSFGYSLTDDISITLGRTNIGKTHELGVKYRFLKRGGSMPLSGALLLGGSLKADKADGQDTFRSEAVKLNLQAPLTIGAGGRAGLAVIPAYSTRSDLTEQEDEGTLAVTLGGRLEIAPAISILGEWSIYADGHTSEPFDSWGVGLEKQVGGHVFQVMITNSLRITDDQYIVGGDLDLSESEFRLGFNIFRQIPL